MSNPRPGRSYDRKCCNQSVSELRDVSGDGDIPVQVGANFVGLASTESVALSATSLEERGTLASVTYTSRNVRIWQDSERETSTDLQRKACLKSSREEGTEN